MTTSLTVDEVREQIVEPVEDRAVRVERVVEPLTYREHGQHSYYRDLALSQLREDASATDRLARHTREMSVELEQRGGNYPQEARFEMEQRVNPSRISLEGGGYFAPPLWLVQYFGSARRASRVIAQLTPGFDLPAGVGKVAIPRITTGTEETAGVDLSPPASRDVIDAETVSKAVAFRGISDWSLQALEQSPVAATLDWVIFTDLMHAYDLALETMIINGTGEGESFKGILTEGTKVPMSLKNAEEGTSKEPKATKIFPYLGQLMARVGNKRKMPPEGWFTTTGRFGWLATSEDSQNRPLLITDYVGHASPAASVVGINLYFNDAIPNSLTYSGGEAEAAEVPAATVGEIEGRGGKYGGNQDAIFIGRPKDSLLLESGQKTRILKDVLSGTLQVRFEQHAYAAYLFRYANAWAYLAGGGMAIPPGFNE